MLDSSISSRLFFLVILNQLNDFQPFFPTIKEDLYGSISAIFLLQDTYNISAKDMANGRIPGKTSLFYSAIDRPDHCHCAVVHDIHHCKIVLLSCVSGSNVNNEIHADDCFELGSFALYYGRYHRAREWLAEALERVRRSDYNGYLDVPLLLEHASWTEYTVVVYVTFFILSVLNCPEVQ